MITSLIIDDEQHSINAIANLLKKFGNYEICGTAKTVEEAIQLTKSLNPDLVFLDIKMGTKTGFDYLNSFRPHINFDIVFTTAYNEFALKAFEYSALHYLLKPIDLEDMRKALSRMDEKVSQQEHYERLLSLEYNLERSNSSKFIHISTIDRHYKVNTRDILYLKSDSNYTQIYLNEGTKITSSKTLKYYSSLLDGSHFYKVSKSYLVNEEQIVSYKKKTRELTMSDDTKIPVALRRQKDFVKTIFS
ncbi:MAG: LytTR family DNA-binding domain-containing protein [Bacteroidota bacterium]